MSTVGDTVRVDAAIQDSEDVFVDPTTLQLTVTSPAGDEDVYTYAADELTRDALGEYYYDLVPDVAGRWRLLWEATGVEGLPNFSINDSVLVTPIPCLVTIHVVNQSAADIVGVRVALIHSSGAVLAAGTTDADGEFLLTVLPGVYEVECQKTKTSFPVPSAITVLDLDGGSQSFTVTGTALTVTAPTPPGRCRLYGYLVVTPHPPRVVLETLAMRSPLVPGGGGTGVNPANVGVVPYRREVLVDNDTGYWEVDVTVGSRVQISVPEMRLQTTFLVPNVAVLNLADARPELTGTEYGTGSLTVADGGT